jgi:hypothetical protein
MTTFTRWLSFVCLVALGPVGAVIAVIMLTPHRGGSGRFPRGF